MDNELLTTEEAAGVLKCAPFTIRKWVREKKLTARRTPGGQLRFTREDLENAMTQEGVHEPTA